MKEYEIYVDYLYGPCEVYVVKAKDLDDAKRKAKARFAKEYFKKSYLSATKAL